MTLTTRLFTALSPWLDAPGWRVAFSGGLDSTVLLHLLLELGQRGTLPPLSAIHIHHGLQSAADAWPAHCARVCERLGVPLEVIRVQVAPGPSLERAARQARYAAFARSLAGGEILLTGQHRDDQAETLLFRLLRGAGVKGLAAMPRTRQLGAGRLVRPLLAVGRAELEAHARQRQLDWIEDPSNDCVDFSRNYLRHRVMPVVAERWPQAASAMARSAAHMAEAQGLLEELAGLDLATAHSPSPLAWLDVPSLQLDALRQLSVARQRNALRHWLAEFGALPDSAHWAGWDALRDAAADASPRWRLDGGEVHRADGRLWFLFPVWLLPPVGPVPWKDIEHRLELPGNGSVVVQGGAWTGGVQVSYRQGGERMQVPRRGRRDLKRLLNEAGFPPFLRGRLPLLHVNGELLAVGNCPQLNPPGISFDWTPPKVVAGLS